MNKRIVFVDLAKGICICLVVLLHVYGESAGSAFEIMNMFRMPLYFVLSGLFFKPYSGFISFTKKKVNKLLIPFLITYLIICVPIPLNKYSDSPINISYSYILSYFLNDSLFLSSYL